VQVEVFEVFVDGVLDVAYLLLGRGDVGLRQVELRTQPDHPRLEASVIVDGQLAVDDHQRLVDPVLPADKRSQLPDHPAAPDEERRGCGKCGSDKGERLHHDNVTVEPYAM